MDFELILLRIQHFIEQRGTCNEGGYSYTEKSLHWTVALDPFDSECHTGCYQQDPHICTICSPDVPPCLNWASTKLPIGPRRHSDSTLVGLQSDLRSRNSSLTFKCLTLCSKATESSATIMSGFNCSAPFTSLENISKPFDTHCLRRLYVLFQHLGRSVRQQSYVRVLLLFLECLRRTVLLCIQTIDCWISSESLNRNQQIVLALLCDCFTILINQLCQFYQPGYCTISLKSSVLCVSTFARFASQTIPRLIRKPWFGRCDSVAPLWVPLMRGLLRLLAIQIFNDSMEHTSDLVTGCCMALRAIPSNSHGIQLCRFLLHELVDSSFVPFPANSSKCNILSRFFVSCLQELPYDLVNYLIDLFYCHFSTVLSVNNLGPYNNNELIFCLWSILLRTPRDTNPRLLRFFFVLLNNLPYAQLDFCLPIMLSGLTEQLLIESSTAPLLTFLSSLLDCAFGLFTRHARHLFLTSLLRTILLPLCLRLPTDRWHTEFGLIFFDQCWVKSLGAYDAYSHETIKLAMACLDCVDTDDRTVSLAASVRHWPTLWAAVIKSLVHLLREPVEPAIVQMGQGMMIQLWKCVIDCLLRLLLWHLQHEELGPSNSCSRETDSIHFSNPHDLGWSELVQLLLSPDIVCSQSPSSSPSASSSVPVITIHDVRLYLLHQLHSIKLGSKNMSVLDQSIEHIRDVIHEECERLRLPFESTNDWSEWCNRFCVQVWYPLLVLLESQHKPDEHSDKYICILLNLFINPLWSTMQLHNSDADHLLFDYLLPHLIDYRAHLDNTSNSLTVPSLLVFVTRLVLRVTPECGNLAIQQSCVPVHHGQTRWISCITMLASKLANASMCRQFELHSLLNESLDMITHHIPCSTVGVAITQLMRSICLRNLSEALSGSQLAVQLSPGQLEQVLRTIQRLLMQKDDVLRCRCDQMDRSKTLLLTSRLIQLLVDWIKCSDPLAPSHYTCWPPSFDIVTPPPSCLEAEPCTLSFRRYSFASACLCPPNLQLDLSSSNCLSSIFDQFTQPSHLNPHSDLDNALQSGLMLSTWIRLIQSDSSSPSFSVDKTSFPSSLKYGDLIHVVSFESVCKFTDACVSTTENPFYAHLRSDWSLQVWISVRSATFHIRAHRLSQVTQSGDADPVLFTNDSWIPLPCLTAGFCDKHSWHHLLLHFRCSWDSNSVEVILASCGGHSQSVILELRKSQEVSCNLTSTDVRQSTPPRPSTVVLFHLGHRTNEFNQIPVLELGNMLLFAVDSASPVESSPQHAVQRLSLGLTLLSPDWLGYLDSMECGARYTSAAWCILHNLVRRSFNFKAHDSSMERSAYLLRAGTEWLLSSNGWLTLVRQVLQISLIGVYSAASPNRIIYRSMGSNVLRPSNAESSSVSISDLNWLLNEDHSVPLYTLVNAPELNINDPLNSSEFPEPRLVPSRLIGQRSVDVNLAFAPHGGIEVAFWLLGQVICDETESFSACASFLQADCLELLFTLLDRSTVAAVQFCAPALPDPGVETAVGNRRERATDVLPLSVGHCLLARLIKHPRFAASFHKIIKVFSDQLFIPLPTSVCHGNERGQSESIQLLWNPSLLRCLMLFAPAQFWLSTTSLTGSQFVFEGLLPHTLRLLTQVLQSNSMSAFASTTAFFLDRWQLLSVACASLREHFLEHSLLCSSEGLDMIERRRHAVLSSLVKLIRTRLIWLPPEPTASTYLDLESCWSVGHAVRSLFTRLFRSVISLDADLYLTATEHVFATHEDSDDNSGQVNVSSRDNGTTHHHSDPTWLWWHQRVASCFQPEQWKIWPQSVQPRSTSFTEILCEERFNPMFQTELETAMKPTCQFTPNAATVSSDNEMTSRQTEMLSCISPSLFNLTSHNTPAMQSPLDVNQKGEQSSQPAEERLRVDKKAQSDESLISSSWSIHEPVAANDLSKRNLDVIWAVEQTAPNNSNGEMSTAMSQLHTQIDRSVKETRTTRGHTDLDDDSSTLSKSPNQKLVWSHNLSDCDRNQKLASAMIFCLDSAWFYALNCCNQATSVSKHSLAVDSCTTKVDRSGAIYPNLITNLCPPLWFVHSLLEHSSVRIREVGLNGYRVWLRHAMLTTLSGNHQKLDRPLPSASRLSSLLASKLLKPSPPVLHSDEVQQTNSTVIGQHLCSSGLLNRAFDLVLDAIGCSSVVDLANLNQQTSECEPGSACDTLGYLCFAEQMNSILFMDPCDSSDKLCPQKSDHTSYLDYSLPLLLSSLVASSVDAMMSLHVKCGQSSDQLASYTKEVDLCAAGLTAITRLLQYPEPCLLPTVLKAGLLPALYQLSRVLELGLVNLVSEKAEAAVCCLLTSLSRLLGRVTGWLIQDSSFCHVTEYDVYASADFRFSLVTNLIRQLLVLGPSGSDQSVEPQVRGVDPGPVSRCLVRRMLYTLLDTSRHRLEQLTNHSPTANERVTAADSSKIKQLFDQLTWTVNNTVDVLTYTAAWENEMSIFLKAFVPCLESTSQCPRRYRSARARRLTRSPSGPLNSKYSPRSPSCMPPSCADDSQGTIRPPIISRSHLSSDKIDYLHELPEATNNPFENFQQSLDQALVTCLFSTAASIQNGTLIPVTTNQLGPISASGCLTVFCKAIGRMLVAKTQPPMLDVALDPVATYLLKLSNEEPRLLCACLASLPRLFSLVFWNNLSCLESGLLNLMTSEELLSFHLPSYRPNSGVGYHRQSRGQNSPHHETVRSASLSRLTKYYAIGLVFRRLAELFHTVRSLLTLQRDTYRLRFSPEARTAHRALDRLGPTDPSINRQRNLLILSQVKTQEQWSMTLPPCLGQFTTRPTGLTLRDRLPTLVSLLMPSFGSTESSAVHTKHSGPMPSAVEASERGDVNSRRCLSAKRLAGRAHRQCVAGHNAWQAAHGERGRIVGPLGTVLWARVADRLGHPAALFHDADSAPGVWCMDSVEGPMRQRRRMFLTHLPLADRLVYPDKRRRLLAHNRDPHPLASLIGLPSSSSHPPDRTACVWSQLPLYLPLPAIPLVQLASASRHRALGVWACRLVGLVHIVPVEGDLILGQSWLRFQPDTPTPTSDQQARNTPFRVNPVDRLWLVWPLTSIDHVEARRYALRNLAVEIFPRGTGINAPALFAMRSTKERDLFIQSLEEQLTGTTGQQLRSFPQTRLSSSSSTTHGRDKFTRRRSRTDRRVRLSGNAHQQLCRLQAAQRGWLNGQLSNFAYLMELNTLAGRSYNDLMQYPIFPWVIRDYHSHVLDLGHPSTYRRLNRPIAVQLDERATAVSAHYRDAELFAQTLLAELTHGGTAVVQSLNAKQKIAPELAGLVFPPYHYPSHCSNEAIVLNFLVRLLPYAFRHLRFQDNNFDVPDRLFHSVATTWLLATTTVTCVKELVPEFYFCPELFTNEASLALGSRQPGTSVDSVELPPWSKNNPRLFVLICRAALESDFVTSLLSEWIDLTFGYKQTGNYAKEALNLYHPYTYFGAIDVDKIPDPIRAQAVEAMINNYGQTSKQLFKRHPHPSRFSLVAETQATNLLAQPYLRSPSPSREPRIRSTGNCPSVTTDSPVYTEPFLSDEFDPDSLRESVTLDALYRTGLVNSEITPLETVIGLRWGTWAGSPTADPLQLIWKQNYHSKITSHSACFVGYMCGAVWFDSTPLESPIKSDPYSTMYCLQDRAFQDAWNGWVLGGRVELGKTLMSTSLPSADRSWHWAILGCESNALVWLSGEPDPQLVKLARSSTNSSLLTIRTRTLHDDVCGDRNFRTLILCLPKADTVTAMTLANVSSSQLKLFVGTADGSLYVRCLPADLQNVSPDGWLPEEFIELDADLRARPLSKKQFQVGPTQLTKSGSSVPRKKNPRAHHQNVSGLWEVTGWRQLIGHVGYSITALAVCSQYGLLASGDDRGRVCLWDIHRLSLICLLVTDVNINTTRNTYVRLRSESGDAVGHYRQSSSRDSTKKENISPPDDNNTCTGQYLDNHSDAYRRIDSLCFCPTSGELAVARWSDLKPYTCWIGVYSTSGTQVAVRLLDFFAEIMDDSFQNCSNTVQRLPVPMAYSTVAEGQGVNCLLLGGPGGRLIWLNSWTLDTVHAMLLPRLTDTSPSCITSVCFTPSSVVHSSQGATISPQLGELLCQGLCVADQAGWVYYLAPKRKRRPTRSSASSGGDAACSQPSDGTTFELGEQQAACARLFAGIWLAQD